MAVSVSVSCVCLCVTNWIAGKILPHFDVRPASVQLKLTILEHWILNHMGRVIVVILVLILSKIRGHKLISTLPKKGKCSWPNCKYNLLQTNLIVTVLFLSKYHKMMDFKEGYKSCVVVLSFLLLIQTIWLLQGRPGQLLSMLLFVSYLVG